MSLEPETTAPPESPQQMDPTTTTTTSTTPSQAPEAAPPTEEPLSLDSLTLPEGLSFEGAEKERDEFLALANEWKLGKKGAEAALNLHQKLMARAGAQMQEQWTALQTEWRNQVQALPEVAANPALAQASVAKILDKYGSAEARQALDVTGAGNNPHVVRMFLKLAKDLTEQPPVSGVPTVGVRDRAQRLYGDKR
mgnify:CR=1 FL=1